MLCVVYFYTREEHDSARDMGSHMEGMCLYGPMAQDKAFAFARASLEGDLAELKTDEPECGFEIEEFEDGLFFGDRDRCTVAVVKELSPIS